MKKTAKKERKIKKIYDLLEDHFGDLGWWPAETDFEVVIGAVLTQNTAWANVEKAIERLKEKKLLAPEEIVRANMARLSGIIRPAGYHRVKSRRLKEISRFMIAECGGRLGRLKRRPVEGLREALLSVKGVGPETADSILVYALGKPVFVVDAYTKRIFSRHGITCEDASYDEVQSLVHGCFPRQTKLFNGFHALLVEAGKRFCRKRKPLCEECPLRNM